VPAGSLRKDAACLAALCAALLFAPPARAGTYDVHACQPAGGGTINQSWAVEPYNSAGDPAPDLGNFTAPATPQTCPASGGLPLVTSTSATKTVRSHDGAAWVFHAPVGNLVSQVVIWRTGQARWSSSAGNSPYWEVVARDGGSAGSSSQLGTSATVDFCSGQTASAWPSYCALAASPADGNRYTGINQPVVAWGVECVGATQSTTCHTGEGTSANAQINFLGATVTVEDDTPPLLAAGSPLDGWHRPGDALTATGSDGGGLRQMAASIDGNAVASLSYTCDFHLAAPCPTAPQLAVPLAGLTDGPHSLTVTGVDVASNGGRSDRAVDVDGTPPTLDLVPTKGRRTITFAARDALSGVKSGAIAIRTKPTAPFTPLPTTLRGGRLRATAPKGRTPSNLGIEVTATDNAGNAISGQATTMSLNTRLGKHLRKVRHASATVPYKHRVVVTGRLTTIDGVPLAGQALVVTTTLRQSHAAPQPFRTVTTGRTGRFSFSVPAGPSRRVDVAFGGGLGLLHRTRSVTLHVPAGSTIKAGRTALFGTGTVRFSGRLGLLGARLPAGGKIVVLEAEQHGHWTTVASTRARGAKAAWHAEAHFRGNPGTFPVRLRIPREAVFPYDAGHSRAIPIRVL
jgi:hypothetical protein